MGRDDRESSRGNEMLSRTGEENGGRNGNVGFAYSDGYQPVPNPKSADRQQLNVTIADDDDEDDQFSQKAKTHLIGAVCVALCCFFPTGLAAVNFAMKAKKLNQENKVRHAKVMAERAKNWIIYTVVAFVLLLTIATVSRIFTVILSNNYHIHDE